MTTVELDNSLVFLIAGKSVLTFAGLLVAHLFAVITGEVFLAVVAVAAGGVVFALQTNAAALFAGQQIQFLVEVALPRVTVTVASFSIGEWRN